MAHSHRETRTRLQRRLKILRKSPRLQFQLSCFIIFMLGMVLQIPAAALVGLAALTVLFLSHPTRPGSRFRISVLADLNCLLEDKQEQSTRFVMLERDYFYMQPALMQSYLRSQGIVTILCNEMLGSMLWLNARATGGVRLLVAAEDYQQARELLDDRSAWLENGVQTCVQCGSFEIEFRPYIKWLAVLSGISNVLLPIPWRRFKCLDCGTSWSRAESVIIQPPGPESDRAGM